MKRKIRLLSMIVSLSLALSGCGKKLPDRIPIEELEVSGNSLEVNPVNQEEVTELVPQDSGVRHPSVVNGYLEYFDSITYNYKGEEFYLSDEEVNNLIEMGNTIKSVDHSNISLDAYLTYSKIKSNSNKVILQDNKLQSCFFDRDKKENDPEFQNAFDIALFHVLKNLPSNESNDISEDFCKFQTLSICLGDLNEILGRNREDSGLLGYYNDETNSIILDKEGIYNLYNQLSLDYSYGEVNYANLIDIIMETLIHELNHVREQSCNCRIEAGQDYFSIADYSEYVPTIIEASAESSIYNAQDYLSEYFSDKYFFDYSYEDERNLESFVLILGLLYNDVDDYYNAIFDSDFNKLYEFAGCENEDDVKRFYHILYNIDALMARNDLAIDIGGEDVKVSDVEKLVGSEYTYEVLDIFTEDLIKYICNHDDISSTEAMTLFIMAESLSLNNSSYKTWDEDGCIDYEYDKDLVIRINNTRIIFENFIMNYYGLNDDELYKTILASSLIINFGEGYTRDLGMEEEYEIYINAFDSLAEKFPILKSIINNSDTNSLIYKYVYEKNGIDYNKH